MRPYGSGAEFLLSLEGLVGNKPLLRPDKPGRLNQNLPMKPALRLLFVLVTLAFTASQASAIPGRAEVRKVFGTAATVTKATGGSTTITVGMVLGAGDTIVTGKSSCVHLWLGLNGEAMQVAPDTTLKLDTLEITSVKDGIVNTSVSLSKGAVTGVVFKKLAAASKYEIKTASGVAGIRGTVYGVKSDGTVVVLKGAVTFNYVHNGQSQNVRLEAGQQFKAGDAAPSPANFLAGEAASFFTDLLATSGISVDPTKGDVGILTALATALDVSLATLVEFVGATGISDLTVINNPADVSTSAISIIAQ